MKQQCDACDEHAIVHLVALENGKKNQIHLCAKCAQEKGLLVQGNVGLPKVSSAEPTPEVAPGEDPVCPDCGCAYSEFRNRGRFGCGHCYRAFSGPPLDHLLSDIHNHEWRHVGKHPREDERDDPRREILECRQHLRQAIEREAYEDAAQLRDRLEALTRKLEES